MWYKNAGTSFFHFVTKHARVWQRDGRTDRKAFAIPCVCITCSRTVKTTAPDRLGGNCPMDPPLAVSASSEVSPNLRRSFLSHSLSSLSLPDLILSWMPEPRSTVPAAVDFAAVLHAYFYHTCHEKAIHIMMRLINCLTRPPLCYVICRVMRTLYLHWYFHDRNTSDVNEG